MHTPKINVSQLKAAVETALEDLMWSNDHNAASLVAKIEAEMASLKGTETVLRWVQKHLPTSCSQKAVANFLRPMRDEEKRLKEASKKRCEIRILVPRRMRGESLSSERRVEILTSSVTEAEKEAEKAATRSRKAKKTKKGRRLAKGTYRCGKFQEGEGALAQALFNAELI